MALLVGSLVSVCPPPILSSRLLPKLRRYYELQGLMPESSRYMFEQFLTGGIGTFPIIVGYESQLIEHSLSLKRGAQLNVAGLAHRRAP